MKEDKRETDNKTHIILLTVIGLVTMIVVIIGATFAYLASSIQQSNTASINATTDAGSDMLLFDTGGNIDILANTENFGPENGNLTSSISASVIFQTTQANSTEKYRVYMTIDNNDFEYSSGSCYVQSDEVSSISSQEVCESNSNLWATTNGTDYSCYAPSQIVTGTYNNELACLLRDDYMWVTQDDAELVMDVYKVISAENESACISSGVCVDSNRNITADGAANCTAASGKTWLSNIYDQGVCYTVDKTYDLTGRNAGDFTVYDEITINAAAGTPTIDNYRVVTTLINFNHNQIINGNKSFNGILTLERITD